MAQASNRGVQRQGAGLAIGAPHSSLTLILGTHRRCSSTSKRSGSVQVPVVAHIWRCGSNLSHVLVSFEDLGAGACKLSAPRTSDVELLVLLWVCRSGFSSYRLCKCAHVQAQLGTADLCNSHNGARCENTRNYGRSQYLPSGSVPSELCWWLCEQCLRGFWGDCLHSRVRRGPRVSLSQEVICKRTHQATGNTTVHVLEFPGSLPQGKHSSPTYLKQQLRNGPGASTSREQILTPDRAVTTREQRRDPVIIQLQALVPTRPMTSPTKG